MRDDPQTDKRIYQITVQGKLDESWSDWFDGMKITVEHDATTLTGHVVDQAALHGILNKIRDLNLALISVNCVIQPRYAFASEKRPHLREDE